MTTRFRDGSHYYRFWLQRRLYERGGFRSQRAALEAEWEKKREVGATGRRRPVAPTFARAVERYLEEVAATQADARHVRILREFRDRFLLTNVWGRRFVRFYYAEGPKWPSVVEGRPGLRLLVRILFLPVAAVAYVLLQPATPLASAFVLVLAVTLGVAGRRAWRWRGT